MPQNNNIDEAIFYAEKNIIQLLKIGIGNSDEQIEDHFGSEERLLGVTFGYLKLVKELKDLKRSESEEK